MQINSEDDFQRLRQHINHLHHRFPMFRHDVKKIERIIEEHIKNHSIALVNFRQTHARVYLEIAQNELQSINRVLSTVGKLELMAMLSQA